MSPTTEFLFDGPEDAVVTVLLAHGAGAGMAHPWMAGAANALAHHGLRVARFEYPYMRSRRGGRKRGPDRMPVLLDAHRAAARECGGERVALAGKSMGGRIGTMLADELADELGVIAVTAFGYPFHPPGKPENLRTAHLEDLRTPTLILQGERDSFGKPDEVSGYGLSKHVQVEWLPDGDHSLAPRKRSGHTVEANLERAFTAAAEFVLRHA